MTSWLKALRAQAGPLLPPALTFIDLYADVPEAEYPKGHEGIAHLARSLDSYCDRDPSDEDREFVEGAGALLSLLLIEHLGGRHVQRDELHRVQLGKYGFFDPFTAVEWSLEADRPLQTLAAEIRHAEAEARGEGEMSRIVACLAEKLEAREGTAIKEQFELNVSLTNGVELDLGRVQRATEGEPMSAVHAAIDKLLDLLDGTNKGDQLELDEIRERILPRLVGDRFMQELNTRAGESELAMRPMGHGVRCTLLLQYQGRARYLRTDELNRWGLDFDAALAIATQNLAARSDTARMGAVETPHGALILARSGDGLDSARLLLPGLRDVLTRELGADCVVGVPHRDTLIACAKGSETLLEALRMRVEDAFARAPHPIAAGLFELTEEGPAAFAP